VLFSLDKVELYHFACYLSPAIAWAVFQSSLLCSGKQVLNKAERGGRFSENFRKIRAKDFIFAGEHGRRTNLSAVPLSLSLSLSHVVCCR
jgi:hypothetical protein